MATLRTKKGNRLTKKVVEELAAEAERGYDLSKARREIVRPDRNGDRDRCPGGRAGHDISCSSAPCGSKRGRSEAQNACERQR